MAIRAPASRGAPRAASADAPRTGTGGRSARRGPRRRPAPGSAGTARPVRPGCRVHSSRTAPPAPPRMPAAARAAHHRRRCPRFVRSSRPTNASTGVAHDSTARPSHTTAQAPHCSSPQPYFVPVSPSSSRNTQSSGVSGSISTSQRWPFTRSSIAGDATPVGTRIAGVERPRQAAPCRGAVPYPQAAAPGESSR